MKKKTIKILENGLNKKNQKDNGFSCMNMKVSNPSPTPKAPSPQSRPPIPNNPMGTSDPNPLGAITCHAI